MPKRILKKIAQIILRIKWHLLRGSLPRKLNFLPSICSYYFFQVGVLIYKNFSWPDYKKQVVHSNVLYSPKEGLSSFLKTFEILKSISSNKNLVAEVDLKTNNFIKTQDALSLLIFKDNVHVISIDLQEIEDKNGSCNLIMENQIPIETFTYNQVSSLPLSSYRETNLFLKRAASCSTLLVLNLPLDLNNNFKSLFSFEELPENTKILINNLNQFSNKIVYPSNVIDLNLCGFSLQEKVAICQSADFYFGVYDSLALGAFDSKSQGIVYIPENGMGHFTTQTERFLLKNLKDIQFAEEDIKSFVKEKIKPC